MKQHRIALSDIKTFAPTFAKTLHGGEIIALVGDLGAGKTTFTQQLGKALKIRKRITSPTFTIVQAYEGKLRTTKKRVTLYHLDLYRLHGMQDARTVGLEEFWGKPGTITAIEWANKIKRYLPKKTIVIHFT